MTGSVRARPPWALVVPSMLTALGVALPLSYLLVRALDADVSELSSLVFKARNVRFSQVRLIVLCNLHLPLDEPP